MGVDSNLRYDYEIWVCALKNFLVQTIVLKGCEEKI